MQGIWSRNWFHHSLTNGSSLVCYHRISVVLKNIRHILVYSMIITETFIHNYIASPIHECRGALTDNGSSWYKYCVALACSSRSERSHVSVIPQLKISRTHLKAPSTKFMEHPPFQGFSNLGVKSYTHNFNCCALIRIIAHVLSLMPFCGLQPTVLHKWMISKCLNKYI